MPGGIVPSHPGQKYVFRAAYGWTGVTSESSRRSIPQPKTAQTIAATARATASATMTMSATDVVCGRNGLKPMRLSVGRVDHPERVCRLAQMTWLRVTDENSVRHIVLNRPERLNAIPAEGWSDLATMFADFENSDQRVLVLTGAGPAFCSGADLDPEASSDLGVVAGHRRMKSVAAAATALRDVSKPTVAAVNGVAVGAGMNLALGCDLVLAGEAARFSEIFVKRGLSIDFGGSWLLPRLVGLQRAKELALTGRMVGAEEARAIGLCLEVVADEQLLIRADQLAQALVAAAPIGQMFTKQMIDRSFEMSFEDAVSWEGQSQSICFTTADFTEGKTAFAEKRSPNFEGR